MKEIKINAVFGKKSEIKGKPEFPILSLTDGEEEWYLMPFRSYCMSINTSEDGDGFECASTRPIMMNVFDNMPELVKAEWLRTAAATCIYEFCHGQNAIFADKTKFDWNPDSAFREFIKNSFKYIWPNAEWPYID